MNLGNKERPTMDGMYKSTNIESGLLENIVRHRCKTDTTKK